MCVYVCGVSEPSLQFNVGCRVDLFAMWKMTCFVLPIYVYVFMNVCMYVHLRIYIYIYIHNIYIYIHIYKIDIDIQMYITRVHLSHALTVVPPPSAIHVSRRVPACRLIGQAGVPCTGWLRTAHLRCE